MKNRFRKTISVILCAVILISCVGAAGVYALTSDKTEEKEEKKETGKITLIEPEEETDYKKNETVYVMTDVNGGVKKIIVSDWIRNAAGSASFSDRSELIGIENVKGNETYTMNDNNVSVWDAEGNDIYYQGNIEKDLPVDISVSYKLDGKSISAEELAGKSGKVSIRFDYKNNQ